MTKTYTEQYKNKELSGWYYVKTKDGSINHWLLFTDTIEFEKDIEEVLGPVPDYMDCKGLIYDSINLADARKRIDELVSKTDKLEKKLEIATKALKEYAYIKDWDYFELAHQALMKIEEVK